MTSTIDTTTTDDAPSPGRGTPRRNDAEVRADAQEVYRNSVADGAPLTGTELGEMFGRSGRWGRLQIAATRDGNSSGTTGIPEPVPAPESEVDQKAAIPKPVPGADEAATTGLGSAGEGAGAEPADPGRRLDQVRNESVRSGDGGRPEPETTPMMAIPESQSVTISAQPAVPEPAPEGAIGPGEAGPEPQGERSVATTVAVLIVALVAAIASYDHQRLLAEQAGEGWRSWLWPLSVDGLIVAASMSMLARRRRGLKAGALAWVSFLAGIGASLAANVAAADPTLVGRLVAAWPPLALLLAWPGNPSCRPAHPCTRNQRREEHRHELLGNPRP